MKEVDEYIETRVMDALLDKPSVFKVAGRYLYLYYPSLGKLKLIERLYKQIKFNTSNLSSLEYLEYLRIVQNHKDVVLRILSYSSMNKKEDLFNELFVRKRIEFLKKNLDDSELAQLLKFSLTMIDIPSFMDVLGITKSNEIRNVIFQIKKNKDTSIVLGGISIYGSLITRACEIFHSGWDEIVWGINYVNLILSLKDSTDTIILSEDERKLLPKSFFSSSNDSDVIDANNPNAWKEIKGMKFK